MNTRRILSFVLLAALLLVITASTLVGASRDAPLPDLSWTVLGAGGGHAASTSYSMDATLGQPFTGPSSGAIARLAAGFWQDMGYRVYLPIVLK
jgi:hypothetical protein